MRLKRVKIFGFKTFADRTEFDLDGGLVAVVGSNGCGKSNLVDAILWGLGEANARQLRAATGADVIFNGSSGRRPVGFAEVTLLFDNEDGALPVEAPEVMVTRKLTRSGDSEYRINRTVCRQRDVFELFADSGLGRAGYAIVGQKEIDTALSASADERRGWVDEAAGVQRYRVRKVEAQRRMAAARTHLERTTDILSELGAQREPLREEAEVAQRYKAVLHSLRQVETDLLMLEVVRARGEAATFEERIDQSLKLAQVEANRVAQIDEEVGRVGELISELEQEMDSVRSVQQGSMTAVERAQSDRRLAEQKLENLADIEATLAQERGDAAARIEEAEAELVELRSEVQREEANLAEIQALGAASGSAVAQLTIELKRLEANLEAARKQEAHRARLLLEAAHRQERTTQARRELQGIEGAEPDLLVAISEAEAQSLAADEAVKAASERITALRAELDKLQAAENAAANEARKSLAEKAALEGRVRGIESTIDAHEGLTQGSRAVLEAVRRGELQGTFVPVGEAVGTEGELATAIETALGGAVNDLIVDTDGEAKAAISWLKSQRQGRATFQPIPLMRPLDPGADFRRLLNERGVVGQASALVTCTPKHRPVIDSLLGRVVVAETLDDALRLVRGNSRAFARIVTLEGEVVHASGSVSGGVAQRSGSGLIQRKVELERLQKEVTKLARVVADFERSSSARSEARRKVDAEIVAISGDRRPLEEEQVAQRKFLHSLRDEMMTAERAKHRLERELLGLEAESEELPPPVDLSAIEAERHELLKAMAAQAADSEGMEERLRDAADRAQQSRLRLQAAERRLAHLTEAESGRQKRMVGIEPERERLRLQLVTLAEQQQAAELARADAERRLQDAQTARRQLLESSLAMAEEAKAARDSMAALSDATHQAELGKARAEGKKASALQRLMEEYGLNEEDAVLAGPTLEVPDDASALVSKFRRELKAMGDVNLGAIEAFERLSVRFDELTAQTEDILGGIRDVEASIAELDNLTRDRFVETFSALQVHFSALFQRLFGGGEGRLELTAPETVLESGIDILVTLPGKKQQPLALLSGGERSLCASSFLFALLEVKSSPLVVLDEVDAPLDGGNVERFADLLLDFAQRTQFIVITHNPTTIAAAPIWLGVTMSEPGISTLVPYREGAGRSSGALVPAQVN